MLLSTNSFNLTKHLTYFFLSTELPPRRFFLWSSYTLTKSLYSSLSILLSFIDLVYVLLNLSLNCLLKIYICEYFIILFFILVLIVFDNEPQTVAVAKAVGIEYGNPIPVLLMQLILLLPLLLLMIILFLLSQLR